MPSWSTGPIPVMTPVKTIMTKIRMPKSTDPAKLPYDTWRNKPGLDSMPFDRFMPKMPLTHVIVVRLSDAMDMIRLASKNLFRAASILASIRSLYI